VSFEFTEALDKADLSANAIPDFKLLNARLNSLSGWQLVTVPHISEANAFFNYLAQKKFTATCWLRSMQQLDYLEEPDMFHDVFGHAPLLSNKNYALFFETMGRLAVKHSQRPEIITKLQRLYWFTIEFGLIRENNRTMIFGAGIISSREETAHAIGTRSLKTAFDLERILNHPFRTDVLQDEYYVIDSFEQLNHSLRQFEAELEEHAVHPLKDPVF
jgi:phenylalanine-4-hydroxylase